MSSFFGPDLCPKSNSKDGLSRIPVILMGRTVLPASPTLRDFESSLVDASGGRARDRKINVTLVAINHRSSDRLAQHSNHGTWVTVRLAVVASRSASPRTC